MFLTSTTDERVDSITIAINAVIQRELAAKTMNEDDATALRDILIRIQTDTAFLNALTNFSNYYLLSRALWASNASANSSSNTAISTDAATSTDAVNPNV